MRKTLILLFLIVFQNLFCQTIAPLYMKGSDISGTYYKDLNNDLDQFVGTWLFSNSESNLTITIIKKTQYYNPNRNVYFDYLIAEYKYEVNNQILVNSLPNLSQNHTSIYDYNIFGYSIIDKNKAPRCPECNINERRVKLNFKDPVRNAPGLTGLVTLRRFDENGIQKTHMRLQQSGSVLYLDDTPATYNSFLVPLGEYILIKQP
jgi:hypothetical protein